MVRNVTIKADFAVVVQMFVALVSSLSIGLVSANEWPKTNINIICTAKASPAPPPRPFSQEVSKRKLYDPNPSVTGFVKNNARKKVTMVRITAIVKGAGNSALNTLVYLSVKLKKELLINEA